MQISVKVKPGAKHSLIKPRLDGSFDISLKSPPIRGRANAELIDVLSDYFSLPKNRVLIKKGLHSRQKTVEILGTALS